MPDGSQRGAPAQLFQGCAVGLCASRGILPDSASSLTEDDHRLCVLYRLRVLCGPTIQAIIGVASPTVLEIGTGVFTGRKKA